MMIRRMIRPELRDLKQYAPSPSLEQISKKVAIPMAKIVKLDTGENPYVEEWLDKRVLQDIRLFSYPDPLCLELREKIGDYTNCDPEWVMCGNGSDELIDLIIRAFVSPGEEIIVNPPTFPMYEFFGQLSGAEIKTILRNKDLSVDVKCVLESISPKTKVVFIDSPGNPTGTVISQEETKQLLEKETIIVIDEAYSEYSGKTVLQLIREFPNLIVLRTFSKWAGLAGMRIGYLIANPEIVRFFLTIKSPYNVNSAAQRMASFVLDNKEKFLAEIANIVSLRKETIERLSRIKNIEVCPSKGAYILIKPKTSAKQIQKFLRKRGVLVKLLNQPLLENCIRVNLGKKKETDKLIFWLRRFYGD